MHSFTQVPFGVSVEKVIEQLKAIAKGDYIAPSSEKRNLGSIVFAAVTLPVSEITDLVHMVRDYSILIIELSVIQTLVHAYAYAHKTLLNFLLSLLFLIYGFSLASRNYL